MPEITHEQAKKFLNEISKKDKVAIIHHDDADGFCSGILFYNHCISKGAKTKHFTYTYSKTSLEKLPLKKFNKIIITDISTKETKEEIKSIKEKEILYVDHHPKFPLPKQVKSLITTNEGYIPASRTAYELIGGKKWLSLIGTISDAGDLYKENNHFINKILKEEKLTLEKFKTKYAYILSDTIIFFESKKKDSFKKIRKIKSLEDIKKIEKYADKVEKEIEKEINNFKRKKEKINGINIYELNTKFNIKSILAAMLSKENPKRIFIFLSKNKSNKKILKISARHSSKTANLPKLLEAATKNLKNSNFGGHTRSSGGQIMASDLEKFKQNIKDYIQKTKSQRLKANG
jgi:single-stranded DNA-specific DHH superfamily exonuclease